MRKKDDKKYNRKKAIEYLERKREKGLQIHRQTKTERFVEEIDFTRMIEFNIPFSGSYSKNVILGRGDFGKRYHLKTQAKEAKKMIYFLIKQELLKNKIKFVTGKIWIDIFVQKPNSGAGDAINVVDLICDGISEAIGIDDRWFCIKSLDWEIKKESPKIFIQVGQGTHRAKKVCSYCSRILSVKLFNKSKGYKDGYSPMCNDCRKPN